MFERLRNINTGIKLYSVTDDEFKTYGRILDNIDTSEFIKAITATPAKVLGKDGEWGVLKEGGCADIAILDYGEEGFDLTDMFSNHISSKRGYKCVLTISRGDVVYRA